MALLLQFSMLASGLTFCIAPFLTSYSLLAADCIVMSFAGGSFVTLAPVLLAEGLGAENLSTAFGFANVCDALPHLLAPALLSKRTFFTAVDFVSLFIEL